MPQPIPTILRSVFSAETPSAARCGYPLVATTIHDLRERFGMLSQWSMLPTDQQLRVYRELCAHYDALVFHDKIACYEHFAHEKAYRTGYHFARSLKRAATENPKARPEALIRGKCIPVSAPPRPSIDVHAALDGFFTDKYYRKVQMDQLMDLFDDVPSKSKYSRLFFPDVPLTKRAHDSMLPQSRPTAESDDLSDSELAAKEHAVLEETAMEMLHITARPAAPSAAPAEDHPVQPHGRPQQTLAAKAERFFRPAEVVVRTHRRARFSPQAKRPDGMNAPAKRPSAADMLMAATPSGRTGVGRVPEGFLTLARRFRYTTWDTAGIFYPRCSYTMLSMYMNSKVPPTPLAPGAIVRNGIVLIPWELHHKAMDGDRNAIIDIILKTAIN